jgi:hypothetical protein
VVHWYRTTVGITDCSLITNLALRIREYSVTSVRAAKRLQFGAARLAQPPLRVFQNCRQVARFKHQLRNKNVSLRHAPLSTQRFAFSAAHPSSPHGHHCRNLKCSEIKTICRKTVEPYWYEGLEKRCMCLFYIQNLIYCWVKNVWDLPPLPHTSSRRGA